jgi:E3 ubiquitin-protein ligase DOA10
MELLTNLNSESESESEIEENVLNENILNENVLEEGIQNIHECRICYENVLNPQKYCDCKGSMGNIHLECLLKWLEVNKKKVNYKLKIKRNCELCKKEINILIYKHYTYYIIIFVLMIFYMVSLSIIYNFTNIQKIHEEGISFLLLFFLVGISYYFILLSCTKKCFKNRIIIS